MCIQASRRMTWTSPGPCTPRLSVCSMSAVRLGPVMATRLLPAATRSPRVASSVGNRVDEAVDAQHGDVDRHQQRRHPRAARAGGEDDRAGLGEPGVGAGEAQRERGELGEPRRTRVAVLRHVRIDDGEPARLQRRRHSRQRHRLVGPAQDRARAQALGEPRDDERRLIDRRRLVHDAGDGFEGRPEPLAARQPGGRRRDRRRARDRRRRQRVDSGVVGARAPCACGPAPPGNRPVRTARPITSRIRWRLASITTRLRAASPSAPGTTPWPERGSRGRRSTRRGAAAARGSSRRVAAAPATRAATRPARPNSRGLVPSQPRTFMPSDTHCGDSPASTPSARRRSSIRGMSMRTGQTSLQAPHSVLACGRSWNARMPARAGESTEPTGPE